MDDKQNNACPHANHRERLRSLFLQSGLDGFSEHNILELLLFYAIPQKDTNPIAHELICRFGSLRGVFNAPVEELTKVKGIGDYAATFLSLIPQVAKRYYAGKVRDNIFLHDREDILNFVRSLFIGETGECAYLISFSSSGQKLGCAKISLGTSTKLQLNRRSLLEAAFRQGAVQVILTHNHPDGIAAPSAEDVRSTQSIATLFAGVDIHLVDHIIVAGEECFSMAENNRYKPIFI